MGDIFNPLFGILFFLFPPYVRICSVTLVFCSLILDIVTQRRTKFNKPGATKMKADDLTLTVDETAKFLRIGRNSAYQGVMRGEIPSFKVGKRILVPRAALERLLQMAEGMRND